VRRAGLLAVVSLVLALAVPAAATPGDLDRTFSGDGWVRSYDISGYSKGFFPKGAEDVAIEPDGKILAVSELQDGNSHWYFGVYRWLPNGDLDRSFGSGGWIANDLGIFPMPHTVALQVDGSILVGGQVECPDLQLCFGIVRYRPNGSIDGSFGTAGIARATFPGSRLPCSAAAGSSSAEWRRIGTEPRTISQCSGFDRTALSTGRSPATASRA
jgi:uncharacterized delta-60 repeat protein